MRLGSYSVIGLLLGYWPIVGLFRYCVSIGLLVSYCVIGFMGCSFGNWILIVSLGSYVVIGFSFGDWVLMLLFGYWVIGFVGSY